MLKKLTDDLIGDLHIMITLLLTKPSKNGEDGDQSLTIFKMIYFDLQINR